jgi:hypothetical protein
MPIYSEAPAACAQIAERMMRKFHSELADAGVTLDFLFAMADPEKDQVHALKLHGYACNAIVKVVPYKLRVQGHADAEIVIDGDQWPAWSDEEKDALIDHEIEHLELKRDKEGRVINDDIDRPKMSLRLHDHEFGWFDSIARRHGQASFEVQQYERFKEAHRQTWLDFEDGEEAAPNMTVSIEHAGKTVTTDTDSIAKAAKQIAGSTRKAASKRK